MKEFNWKSDRRKLFEFLYTSEEWDVSFFWELIIPDKVFNKDVDLKAYRI